MERRFAGDQDVAVGGNRGVEERAAAAAGNGDAGDGLVGVAGEAHPFYVQERLGPLGEFAAGEGFANEAATARALFGIAAERGFERGDLLQTEADRQVLVDAGRSRIERRVGTVDGDRVSDKVEQQSANGGGGSDRSHGPEGEGVMRDDQVRALVDRFLDGRRGDREAGHDAIGGPAFIADQ